MSTIDTFLSEVPIGSTPVSILDVQNEINSSGHISNLIEDLTPQLGGNLDANNKSILNIVSLLGGTASGDDIIIESTSNATKGFVNIQPNGGNVGIGITNPATRLSVTPAIVTGTADNPAVDISNEVDSNFNIKISGTSSTDKKALIGTSTTSDLGLMTANVERVRIDTSGNVGIGNTSPNATLDITGNLLIESAGTSSGNIILKSLNTAGSGVIRWQDSSGNLEAGIASHFSIADQGSLEFMNGAAINMILTGAGKVGIGTTTPGTTLEVNGVVSCLRQDDTIVTATAGSISTDCDLAKQVGISLTANSTINAPTNPSDGQILIYRFIQDATGGRTVTYNAIFEFTTTVPDGVVESAANAITFVMFTYIASTSKWRALSISK